MTSLRAPELAPDTGDITAERPLPARRAPAGAWLDRTISPWSLGVVFAGFALVVVLTAQPNQYVVDNLFAWFWRPTAVLRSWLSPWDPQGGLGAARPDFSPVFVGAMAIVRSLGFSAAIAERIAHAALLVTAGLGAVQTVRLFIPRVRALHAIVGFLYMFNPYSATFILPSALFLNYALAPWFVYVVVRGIRNDRRSRWRAPAAFALLVFVAGLANVPGLGWALLPLLPAIAYVVLVERSARVRDLVVFLARAALLTVIVMAAGLVKMKLGAPRLQENLNNTETLGVVSIASSWSESWRGLGFWLSYWSDAHGLTIARTKTLFTSPLLVAATFAWPIGALASLRVSRWRPRLLFAGMALAALVGMVGIYPYAKPTPFGRVLRVAYDNFPSLYGFRNSYKAGAGLMLGIAVLLSVGIVELLRRSAHRIVRAGVGVAVVALVVATTYPFWIGGLYGRGGQTKPTSVPSYYPASFSWLDAHLGDARALILPGTANSWYRWGFVGDDIVNAYMRHQYVLRGLLPFSNSEADSIVTAIDDRVNNGTLEPGMIAPIARRLGIRYIMLRNDLDWRKSERPRPVLLDALRHDPEIFRVATFGSPGQNVTDPGDTSVEARAEHKLPPVEIYQVWAPSDPPRVVSAQKPLLLAGDGAAWPLLARNEALTPSAAVISTRDLTRNQLAGALRNGANVAITDTNRRTSTFVTQTSQQTSYTLGRSEVQKRGMAATTDPTRSQSVATFSDASDIREISPTSRSAPDTRPALAFDGDRRTAWLADAFAPPDARLRIELRAPHVVSHVDLVAARLLGTGRELTGVDIRFSDGSSVPVGLENRSVSVDFAPRRVSWIEIAFTRVAGAGVRPIGLAEISFRNLLLGESIEVPEDVFNLAAGDPGTAQLLAQAPFRYQFERQRTSTTEVEGRLARTFRTTGTHTFTTLGTLQLDGTVRDSRVDHVLNGVSGATSSVRYDFSLANTGSNAFDGRIETGWVAPAKLGPTLYLHFPPQPVMHVAVKAHTGPGLSRLMRVRVVVGSYSREVGLVPEPACGKGAAIGLTPCELVGGIDLPAPVVGGARVVVTDFSARSGGAFGAAPVRIDEVELNGKANPAPVDTSELTGCIDDVVKVDGRSLPIALYGTRRDLLTGVSVPFTACRTLQLGPGAHTLRTGVPVNDLTFNDERAQTPPPSGSVGTISQSAAATKLQVSASAGDLLLGGFSFDRNWKATVDGHPLAGPEPVDGQSAWVVPHALEAATVQLSYRPQKTYDRALFVTLAGLVLCGGILFRTRRRRAA